MLLVPFSIPNLASATYGPQAEPDSGDFVILADGSAGTGVRSGCAVTAQGVPDMTVAVASGTVAVGGTAAAVTAGNLAIGAAHATNPRIDLVVVSSTGTKSVVAGAPAAAPVYPAIPASSVVLAAVYVPAAVTAITSTMIVDKRVTVASAGSSGSGESVLAIGTLDNAADVQITTASTALVDIDAVNLKVTGTVPASGKLKLLLQGTAHSSSGVRSYWGIRDASGAVAAAAQRMMSLGSSLSNPYAEVTYYLEGLAPGAAFDYRFAWRGSGANAILQYGGQYGPLKIIATAVA